MSENFKVHLINLNLFKNNREFVGPNSPNWMHIDMASVMINNGDYSYMSKGNFIVILRLI